MRNFSRLFFKFRGRDSAVVRALASHQYAMWLGIDSRTRRHMWVEFVVGPLLCSRGFSPGTPVFPSPQKPTFPNFNSIRIFQWTNSHYLWRCHLNSHLIWFWFWFWFWFINRSTLMEKFIISQGFRLHLKVPDAVVQLMDVHRSRRWREPWVPEARTPRVRRHAPLGKFVKFDFLKCNFLRFLNRNWRSFKALKNAHKKWNIWLTWQL